MPELSADARQRPRPRRRALRTESAGLDALAIAALDGDAGALESLLVALSDDLYNVALRMVWEPAEAEDATQEALIRVVTGLAGWRREASVRTWAWRIALRHLLDRRRGPMEQAGWTFESFGDDLAMGLADPNPSTDPAAEVLAEEVRLGCTLGMLQCLDRDQRIAYILGDVLELPSALAAEVTGIAPATHRKRLSRARGLLRAFVTQHCGIVDPSNRCRCARRIQRGTDLGRVDPQHLRFADHPSLSDHVEEMSRLHDLAALMRAHPEYRTPERVLTRARQVVQTSSLATTTSERTNESKMQTMMASGSDQTGGCGEVVDDG